MCNQTSGKNDNIMTTTHRINITELQTLCQQRLKKLFSHYVVDAPSVASRLQHAAAYSISNGGKRIRPLLVYATGLGLGGTLENCDAPACAIEFIHNYSLIHDDLPAMDNADLRRGKPSCHKAFDEATAILVGDALQPLAFEVLATHPNTLSDSQRLAMINILSQASGFNGMVAGQMMDLEGILQLEEYNFKENRLESMYQLKTGALLSASAQSGAIAAGITHPDVLNALNIFAQSIGLAFQIQDDLLDLEHAELTGKPQGIDDANHKITYPKLVGIEKTKQKIKELFASARDSINMLGTQGELLQELTSTLIKRNH